MNRLLVLALILATAALFTGCSGGGGGSDAGGTGVDPVEVEVNTALDVFVAAINRTDLAGAMNQMDSSLKYLRGDPIKYLGYNGFRDDYLAPFLQGAASVTLTINSPGFTGGENSATIRCQLVCRYLDGKNNRQTLTENCEISFERVSKWSITQFSGWNSTGLAFPPAP